MDSNLINIDDLVKQRLSGGEERERSGAWMRMQELLDQEERRKPFGFIFWRRAVGTIGLLLLIAMLTVGGYEMTNGFRGLGNAGTVGNGHDGATASAPKGHVPDANSGVTTQANKRSIGESPAQQPTATTATSLAMNETPTAGNTPGTDNQQAGLPTSAGNANGHSNMAKVGVVNTSAHTTGNNTGIQKQGNVAIDTKGTTVGKTAVGNTAHQSHTSKKSTAANNSNNNTAAVNQSNPGLDNNDEGSDIQNMPLSAAANTGSQVTPTDLVKRGTGNINHNSNSSSTQIAKPGNIGGSVAASGVGLAKTKVSTGNQVAAANNEDKVTGTNSNTGNTAATASNTKAKLAGQQKATGATSSDGSIAGSNRTSLTRNGKKVYNNYNVGSTPEKAGKQAGTHIAASKNHDKPGQTDLATVQPIASRSSSLDNRTTGPKNVAVSQDVAMAKTDATADNTSKAAINKAKAGKSTSATSPMILGAAANTNPTASKGTAGQGLTTTKTVEEINTHRKVTGNYPGKLEMHDDTISIDKTTVETKHALAANTNAKIEDADDKIIPAASASAVNNTGKLPKAKNVNVKGHEKVAKKGTANKSTLPEEKTAGQQVTSNGVTNQPSGNNAVAVTTPGPKPRHNESMVKVAPIMPLASMPPFAAPPPASATLSSSESSALAKHKKKGTSLVESLMSTFNEIKYKVGTAHVAPGLTAGIDGTFFGPNSCKGFQMGVTANFEFDDRWSMMTELKYFHRMNNTFFMHVTYDNYTAIPNGTGYIKQLTEIDYTFSTLHSFELPVTLRYAKGKMNFFGGLNFLYTLGVNITGDPIPDQNVPATTVSTIGTNNAPSLQPSDFAARFGIGYLFGATYKIAPNMDLDLRNAQTFWDNSKQGSSRLVSSQLFKSPSLQFSLFYRFGHKDNNK